MPRQSILPPFPTRGLAWWSSADFGVELANGNVAGWLDRSGNGAHLSQGASSKYPTLSATGGPTGGPCLTLSSASTQCLSNNALVIGPTVWTYFSIHKFTSSASNPTVLSFGGSGSTGNTFTLDTASGNRNVAAVGVASRLDGAAVVSTWEVWVATNDGTTTLFWVNGVQQSLTNATTQAATSPAGVNVGFNTNVSNFFTGSIDTQGAFSTNLSAAEVAVLNRYLGARAGIVVP